MRRKSLPVVTTEGFHFDEKRHLYFFDGKPMTGCTTILGVLAKPALINWAAKMAVEHIQSKADFYKNYDRGNGDVGEEYIVRDVDIEAARTAHAKKRDTAADAGTALHAAVELYVKRCIQDCEGFPKYDGIPEISAFVTWAQRENIRFIATEQRLYSKELWVAGTCDLIFEKDGRRYVADVKTYKKIWDKVPLIQCAGYALMWEEMHQEYDLSEGREQDPARIDGYCIICLPKERAFNEAEDIVWSHDVEADREAFINCVRLYRYLNNK